MFVCSYTDPDVLAHTPKGELGKGINVYRLDGKTGKLVSEETLSLRPNPAFLVAHPTRPLLYGTMPLRVLRWLGRRLRFVEPTPAAVR